MNSKSEQSSNRKTQYCKDWTGYSIPKVPKGMITFAETKSLAAFCEVHYGELGRVARFVKYIIHRQPLGSFPMGRTRPPGSLIFFPVCELNAVSKCQDISYESTEGKNSYFEGVTGPSGDVAALVKVTRELFFDDNYNYWPNGELRELHQIKSDGSDRTTEFDEKGEPAG